MIYRGPYVRRASIPRALATVVAGVPARAGVPSFRYAIDGQCYAYMPIIGPSDEPVYILRAGGEAA